MYTITVTAAELDNLRATLSLAVDRSVREHVYREIDRSTLAALDAAKPVKKRAASKPAEPVKQLVSQGDPALDAFIAAHHDPKYKPLPLPKGAPFPGSSPRPLRVELEDAIFYAKKHKWPGSYSGNFAAPKTRRA